MACVRRKRCKLCIGVFVAGIVGYLTLMATMPAAYRFKSEAFQVPCTIPDPDPFDPSIKQFFWKPDPLVCESHPSLVFVDELNFIRINKSALEFYNIRDESDIVCSVREVERENDFEVRFSNWIEIPKLPSTLSSDFNHLVCKVKTGSVIYDNIVHSIGSRQLQRTSQPRDESHTKFSVLLFGVDSVSRSASIRYLPKTRQYLKELGAYDFKGYMKVGDNTFPNLFPLLTGRVANVKENPRLSTGVFDDYPFLWKNFTSRDYVTLFAEDMPHLNVFNNGYHGFHSQPTDHYMRDFWLALAERNKLEFKLSNVYRFLENKGVKISQKSIFCNQNTPNHVVQLNYIKQFFQTYKGKRKFAFSFLTELAHTFINFLSYGDDVFVDFLKWMKLHGFLDNTILIMFSDHGSRFNKLRNTYIGRIESRMPMLSIVLPKRLKNKFPNIHKALQKNTNRLITHFDLHQTLLDISGGNFENPSTQFVSDRARGVSLFQPISEQRSCHDAWIPEEYCACYTSVELDKDSPDIQRVASKIVQYLNKLLSHIGKCLALSLHSIISAREETLGLKQTGSIYNSLTFFQTFSEPESNRRKYFISLQTVPGMGLFEATCEVTSDSHFNVIGSVDRINKYGNQSHCVEDKLLKQYCFCETDR